MTPEHTDANALFIEGNRYMAIGDAHGAEKCFREATRIAPNFAEAYSNLGFLLDKRGASEQAEVCYRRSIALNPGYAKIHMNLGAVLANRKRFEEAEAAYGLAISRDP